MYMAVLRAGMLTLNFVKFTEESKHVKAGVIYINFPRPRAAAPAWELGSPRAEAFFGFRRWQLPLLLLRRDAAPATEALPLAAVTAVAVTDD